MTHMKESSVISGVYVVHLRPFGDERGRFTETFRKEWFPQRSWEKMQVNRSDSQPGVLRGLHYHHHQVDYWYALRGTIRAGLVDLRPSSATFRATQTIEMGDQNEVGLFIPVGVAHGFVALTAATLTYVVDNYYNGGADEFGIAWNDPEVNLDWGITAPIVSPRDAQNPLLKNVPAKDLPR